MTQAATTDQKAINNNVCLMMVHGAGGGAWYFKNYTEYFSKKGIYTHALNLRRDKNGSGNMDATLDDYVDDVILAAKAFEGKKLVILGHSMGAAVLLKALERKKDLCERAILMSPPPISGIDEKSPLGLFFGDMLGYLRVARKDNIHQGLNLEGLLSKMMFNDHLDMASLKLVRKRLVTESQAVKQELLKPYLHDVKKITTPLVLIGSKDDQLVNINDLFKMQALLKCEFIILNDLPHFMMLDPQWEKSAQAVLQSIYNSK